jgi:hypothetical protein
MAISIFPKKWTSKPPVGTQINWSHSLANGLVLAYLYNEGGGLPIDLLSHKQSSWFNGTGYSWQSGKDGMDFFYPDGFLNTLDTGLKGGKYDNISASRVSMATRVYPVSYGYQGASNLINKGNAVLQMSSTDTKILIIPTGSFTYAGTGTALPLNQWHTLVGSLDGVGGSYQKLWVNGVDAGVITQVGNGSQQDDSSLTWGLGGNQNQTLNGLMSYAYVWNRILSADEARQIYLDPYCFLMPPTSPARFFVSRVPAAGITVGLRSFKRSWPFKPTVGTQLNTNHIDAVGLSGAWLFNEGGGLQVHDLVSINHGSLAGSTSWSTGIGQTGASVRSPGSVGSNVSFPNSDAYNFDTTQDFTVVLRASFTNSIGGTLLEKWNQVDNAFPFAIRCGGGLLNVTASRYDGTNNPFVTSSSGVGDGKPHDIVFTRRAGQLVLYIDGVKQGSTTDTTTATTKNTSPLYALERGNGTTEATGAIEFVYTYNRGMDATQAMSLHTKPYAMFQSQPSLGRYFAAGVAGAFQNNAFQNNAFQVANALFTVTAAYISVQEALKSILGTYTTKHESLSSVNKIILSEQESLQALTKAAQSFQEALKLISVTAISEQESSGQVSKILASLQESLKSLSSIYTADQEALKGVTLLQNSVQEALKLLAINALSQQEASGYVNKIIITLQESLKQAAVTCITEQESLKLLSLICLADQEALKGISNGYSSIQEASGYATKAITVIQESLKAITVGTTSKQESLSQFSSIYKSAQEALLTASRIAVSLQESGGQVNKVATGFQESLLKLVITDTTAQESLKQLSSVYTLKQESLKGVTQFYTSLHEARGQCLKALTLVQESTATISKPVISRQEALSALSVGYKSAQEALLIVTKIITERQEALQGISVTALSVQEAFAFVVLAALVCESVSVIQTLLASSVSAIKMLHAESTQSHDILVAQSTTVHEEIVVESSLVKV